MRGKGISLSRAKRIWDAKRKAKGTAQYARCVLCGQTLAAMQRPLLMARVTQHYRLNHPGVSATLGPAPKARDYG